MPFLPSDVERNNPALAQEFEMVTSQLREFTTRIALLDRVHSIKVLPAHSSKITEWSIHIRHAEGAASLTRCKWRLMSTPDLQYNRL